MKFYLACFVFSFISIMQLSCSKNEDKPSSCTTASVESQEPAILTYAATNSMIVTKHPSGLYYQIINPGTGSSPTLTSKVYVRYKGNLINDNNDVFDEQTDHTKTGWSLNTLIQGWQIGIPLIKKGGTIKLLIPAALAYGCDDIKNASGRVVLPGNSILAFNIDLVDFQ